MIRRARFVAVAFAVGIVIVFTVGSLVPAQPATATTTATEPEDLKTRLDALATEAYPHDDEPGAAVLVAVDGKPVLRRAYGVANAATGAKLTPDMIFRIGSITKQFTAVAILQLVQQERVRLDDPITKYVPDVDTRGRTITIEHLLTHTSGIPNYTAVPKFDELHLRKLSPRQIVALVDDQPLDFEPGSQFRYSNTGYVLLGMVIERASGQQYADYMREHVFQPAGLRDTRYAANDFATARQAHGYDWSPQDNGFVDTPALDMSQPFAAGAIESTVDDLSSWTRTLGDGTLVDLKLLERAWTPFTPTNGKSNYGYGWEIAHDRAAPDERWIRHNGGINGFQSSAIWIPERHVFVAVLSNALGAQDPSQLARRLALEALGRPPKLHVAITLDEQTLERYLGVYEISPKFKLTVTRDGQRLFIQGTNQSKAEGFAEANDRFFSKVVDAQFEFHGQGDHADSLTLFQNGREVGAKRVSD
jgi:CubicO group peptidase (beta-lactamase class C family)